MLKESTRYGIKRTVPFSFEDTIEKVTAALKTEGFGILTEIDVKATMKKKLDKDFRPYIILGACNPPLAYEALTEESDIGLLLPCNVVVYADEGTEQTIIAAIDPETIVQVTGREDLEGFASTVKHKLARAIDAV